MKEALFYSQRKNKSVSCKLCAHFCVIKPELYGKCGVRFNQEGILYTKNYSQVVALSSDPVEKKPLYHFLPNTFTYSLAAIGCNFRCGFCQNWQISQVKEARKIAVNKIKISAQEITSLAKRENCQSLSYTYTEPTVFFELAYDCCTFARQQGLRNIFVTNGYMSSCALNYIFPYLDAVNIDLKSFSEKFYRAVCKASLKPVLDTIVRMKEKGVWIELTTLLICGYNDSKQELLELIDFIVKLDKNIPWHINCFYPSYKYLNVKATKMSALQRAYSLAKEAGINFVYMGNSNVDEGQNTYCPACNKLLIKRVGFNVITNEINQESCPFCHEKIPGVWV